MTTNSDPWVRVKSEDELRAGMVVEVRPCAWCRKRERVVLVREDTGRHLFASSPGGVVLASGDTYDVAGGCTNGKATQLDTAVRDGRIFRLADDQLADLSETRELETVQ